MEKGVGTTSLMIAAARSLEAKQSNPLFNDPYAHSLSGDLGYKALQLLEETMTVAQHLIAARTKYIDNYILSSSNIDQLVILGCGMDTRG